MLEDFFCFIIFSEFPRRFQAEHQASPSDDREADHAARLRIRGRTSHSQQVCKEQSKKERGRYPENWISNCGPEKGTSEFGVISPKK